MHSDMEADLSNPPTSSGAATRPSLTIHVNGEPRKTDATTLAALIDEAGYGGARVATALNCDFVPAKARGTTTLKAGDHVEIVAPRQGG